MIFGKKTLDISSLKDVASQLLMERDIQWVERLNTLYKNGHIKIETSKEEPVFIHDAHKDRIQLGRRIIILPAHQETMDNMKKEHEENLAKVNAELEKVKAENNKFKESVKFVKEILKGE